MSEQLWTVLAMLNNRTKICVGKWWHQVDNVASNYEKCGPQGAYVDPQKDCVGVIVVMDKVVKIKILYRINRRVFWIGSRIVKFYFSYKDK